MNARNASSKQRSIVRRQFLGLAGAASFAVALGCRNHQTAHVLDHNQNDMVGSHAAGAETFNPLVQDAVAKLLGRHMQQPVGVNAEQLPPIRICFVGVENRSAEALGDFREQLYQQLDTAIVQSQAFQPINRRFVDAGLHSARLRPDELFRPEAMRTFTAIMEQSGQPFEYLLFATLTSGTTQNNNSKQRDYLLTLEMVNVRTGDFDKQSATVRKGYHKSKLGKIRNYGFFGG